MMAQIVATRLMSNTSVMLINDPKTPMRQPVNLSFGPKISLIQVLGLRIAVMMKEPGGSLWSSGALA